jgi:dTDP-4-dehydrorhamnose 3,5-epimerase
MIFTPTRLSGAYRIDLTRHQDERGFFARAWCQKEFEEAGLVSRIVQVNLSRSFKQGTLRGLHYQAAPYAETKVIRCTRGAIWDAIVDVRPASPTFKQWLGLELTADNYTMLYVPEGFAHGFITLTDDVEVTYQVSQFYTPGAERGIRWNDPALSVEWPEPVSVISEKDAHWPDFVDEGRQEAAA